MRAKFRAFTLIELLVVVAIIALLVSILVPALNEARRQAKVVVCSSNLHQYALGMVLYAQQDPSGRFPQNNWWGQHHIWGRGPQSLYANFPEDRYGYLDRYLELMGGGNGDIFWCPFDQDQRPGLSPWYTIENATDPRYGDTYLYLKSANWDDYFIGYVIFAAWETGGLDWSNSGNTRDGPAMGPSTSFGQDVILADMVMSDTGYIDNHADNPRDFTTHRENNVAYSDGHVETHYHRITETLPWPHWEEHYVLQSGLTYWLY